MTSRWNHNIHYHPVILEALPSHCLRVLDVGCGEGTLARQLRAVVPEVTAIDLDPASIDLARRHSPADPIDYILGDARYVYDRTRVVRLGKPALAAA